jgi:single-strand DNA-binding protein
MIANLTITGTITNPQAPIADRPNFVTFDLFINDKDKIKVSYWSQKDTPPNLEAMHGLTVLVQGEVFDHGDGVSLKADTMAKTTGKANNIILFSAINRPELRTTKTNKNIFSFGMRSKSWNGLTKENVTTWFKCSAWEKQADTLVKYVQDKSYLIVNGEFKLNHYKTKDGEDKTSYEVTVKSYVFCPKAMQPNGGESGFTGSVDNDYAMGTSTTSNDSFDVPF